MILSRLSASGLCVSKLNVSAMNELRVHRSSMCQTSRLEARLDTVTTRVWRVQRSEVRDSQVSRA